jgi:TolB-like protein/DNA-binding winged helix-turn-helix (wHTH) protein
VPNPPRIRFERFEFDPASGELLRNNGRVRLQRQPARLLELLLAHAGRVVTREEIREALWGDEVHVDFERSLNFCVGKLRAALEDDASAPRFVETVPTRGYRFIAAVEDAGKKSAEGADRLVAGRVFRPGLLKSAVLAAVLLGVGAGVFVKFRGTAGDTPKIVVVPFHNETGSPDFDRVAKGVSDAAVARLAAPDHLSHLRVIGNATDVSFSFKPRDMREIGIRLGAQYLVLGQLKRDNAHFRVIAHLIRVSDQTHVWATTFDRDSLDLSVQAAIAEEIAKAVSAHM